jgi:hypothetical protein
MSSRDRIVEGVRKLLEEQYLESVGERDKDEYGGLNGSEQRVIEQGPDDESLGGCLAGVGQAIRFVSGQRLSHVLIRHLPSPNSCVLGVGTRSRCAFPLPGYPHRMWRESRRRPGKSGD